MFRRLPDTSAAPVRVSIDGVPFDVQAGDTVAAAMLGVGVLALRATPVSGSPRAPYCMMGACFECLVAIDGVASRQACRIGVREGMRIETTRGPRVVES